MFWVKRILGEQVPLVPHWEARGVVSGGIGGVW